MLWFSFFMIKISILLICSILIADNYSSTNKCLTNRFLSFFDTNSDLLKTKKKIQFDTSFADITIGSYYNDIIHFYEENSSGKIKNKTAEQQDFTTKLFYNTPKAGISLLLNKNNFYQQYINQHDKRNFTLFNEYRKIGLSFWYNTKHVLVLADIKKKTASIIDYNELKPTNGMLKCPSFDYHCMTKFQLHPSFIFGATIGINTLTNTDIKFQLNKDGSYRLFPFLIRRKFYSLSGEYARGISQTNISFMYNYIYSDTVSYDPKRFSHTVEAKLIQAKLTETFNLNTGILNLFYSYNRIAGYCKFSENNFDFFRFNSMVFHKNNMGISYKTSNLLLAYHGEIIRGYLPLSYLDFAPFSAWTVLFPIKFKYQNMHISFVEHGLSNDFKFFRKKRNSVSIKTIVSYVHANSSGTRKEKKIIGLIPIWIHEKNEEIFNFHGAYIGLGLKHTLKFKRVSCITNIDQIMPFWIKKRKRGGTHVSVSFMYYIY